jgi:hypothetical protein
MGKDYSQNGESTIIDGIFKIIKPKSKFCVEFGGGDGQLLSNTKYFIETFGWRGLLLDIEPKSGNVLKEAITPSNINDVLRKYNSPDVIDLISIDIDGNDHHVFKNLNYNCSVVVIEYNSNYDKNVDVYMEETDAGWNGNEPSYSASYKHMKKIGEEKGYFLYKEVGYCNLIFINNEHKDLFEEFDDSSLSLPNKWGYVNPQVRKMITVN